MPEDAACGNARFHRGADGRLAALRRPGYPAAIVTLPAALPQPAWPPDDAAA
ncbi:MAG: hypothetical protein WDN49_18255 [Acetobacteraceae bacterium]